MVAISLYRGNLHRVEDVPRQWVMPRPGISMKDFRRLLRRRSKALSLLKSHPDLPSTVSNIGNPPLQSSCLPPLPVQKRPDEQIEKFPSLLPSEADNIQGNLDMRDGKAEDEAMEALVHLSSLGEGKAKDVLQVDKDNGEEKEKKNEDPNPEGNHVSDASNDNEKRKKEVEEKLEILTKKKHSLVLALKQGNHVSDASNDNEKRKKEVEEKLEILTKKKHSLVLALKQILNAEEELKRKSSIQQASRPCVSLQVEVSNDSGSIARVATPKTGSEVDDVLNHDLQSRHIPRMSSSISPSAESALKRPYYFQHNVASNPPRSSPLRFAFPGNQTQPSNLPSVTVPGTNYTVSSSSPAASVGTSSFKDARPASS